MELVKTFLSDINGMIASHDGPKLASYIVIEPDREGNFRSEYKIIIEGIRSTFSADDDTELETLCSKGLPNAVRGADGTPWNEFVRFMVAYFRYLTKVNIHNLFDTYDLLGDLLQRGTSALKHQVLGITILPTVIQCSQALAQFAIRLDANPGLMRTVKRLGGEDGVRESLPERCANTIRGAFTECFKDRTGPESGVLEGRPAGRRVGIYQLVNLCLRVIFKCDKLEAAHTIFEQVAQYSPPLSVYPKAQQVTYLYYLGRFHCITSHFYSASAALSGAYALCPKGAYDLSNDSTRQRRLILIYLIASNIILGRFPSDRLFSLPEATGLAPYFQPLVQAIRKGDLASFRRITSFDSPFSDFFWRHRIMLQLTNRCEPLVWRSLIRKTFLLAGDHGDPVNRKAPTLDLNYVLQLLRWMERRALVPLAASQPGPGKRNLNWIFNDGAELRLEDRYVAPEFRAADGAPGGSVLDTPGEAPDIMLLPDMAETMCVCASLVSQGFMNGYISHKLRKFAVQGARQKGVLAAGFPRWSDVVRQQQADGDDDVPGWKKDAPGDAAGRFGGRPGGFAPGPGSVVRLSGARPVGMGP